MGTMKAQVSTELLTVYAILLVVFISSFAVVTGQIPVIASLKNSMDAFSVASSLGSAMNSVYLAGDGANATLDLGRKNASISIEGGMLDVRVEGSFYDWQLLTNSTSASNVSTGSLIISNSNGVVSVANA